jgi:aldehyde dehydrogenase (NAD+)
MEILELVEAQRAYFASGVTKDIRFRKKALMRFRESVHRHEKAITDALYADFKKSVFESMATEVSLVNHELDMAIKELWKWQQPKKVTASLLNFPSSDYIHYEPYGSALVIAPWNYPYQLAMAPLIGALAAGNTVLIKPSELTPNTSAVIAKIISEVFDPGHVNTIQGDKEVAQALLALRWDYIFFTGSVSVGKIIAKAAAEHLTPVTLELGGKSPCIVDETALISQTAKRIVWGKFINAGQTCIAPDYVLVHQSKKEALLKAMDKEITKAYGSDPKISPDFARIINRRNFDRLSNMLEGVIAATGGELDPESLYISPTILDIESTEVVSMQGEIFGPILPVLSYATKEDIKQVVLGYEKPLSAYVFSRKRSFKQWFTNTFSFGGGVINDTLVHFVNEKLAFGGVGHSGLGNYHGKHSFYTFSHAKPIVKRGTWIDIPFRYAPYKGKIGLIKFVLKWLS